MLASMYDATYPLSIPADVPAPGYTMGYVDGRWPTYEAMRAKYPTAIPVAISAIPDSPTSAAAQGWDGESGDYSPDQAAHFSASKLVLGVVPFGYCSWSDWHDYQLAHAAIGIDPARIDWGIAAYPGIGPVLYPGSVYHQFIDHGSYDESVVAEGWNPGRPLVTNTPSEVSMSVSPAVTFNPGRTDVFQVSFGMLWHKWLDSSGWHNEVLAGGFSQIPVTRGVHLNGQQPQVAILGNQCIVTIEAEDGRVWYLAQTAGDVGWGVNELP